MSKPDAHLTGEEDGLAPHNYSRGFRPVYLMNIVLTGATGFLGLRLLNELLQSHRELTLLTHVGSVPAVDRIMRYYTLANAPTEFLTELPERLRVVETDLTEDRLGLTPSAFQELADNTDVIWHSAGNINLEDDLTTARRTNVGGTRHMLELAAAGRRHVTFHHVSTAYVAGARREGVVYEDALDATEGFENPYEQSKFEAEILVRRWARDHRGSAIIFRPSILISDQPPHPGLPAHPLQAAVEIMAAATKRIGSDTAAPVSERQRSVIRVVGHPAAGLNLTPVEDAARAMVRLAARPCERAVETYHIVHDRNVPISVFFAAVERLAPVRYVVVSEPVPDPSPLETILESYRGFWPYISHLRRFDDTSAQAALDGDLTYHAIDTEYLVAGMRPVAEPPLSSPVVPEEQSMMRAVKLVAPHTLHMAEIPIPKPGHDEVLVKIAGAGLCHSDLHMLHLGSEWPFFGNTLGHEGAGWVEVLGAEATGLAVGDAVLISAIFPCGHCRACREGRENVCQVTGSRSQLPTIPGLGSDGAMAEYLVVPARYLDEIGGLDPVTAAPLADAGMTPMHAINTARHRLTAEATAVVVGIGGLGHLGLQILKATTEARVIAVDVEAQKLDLARRLGADLVFESGPDTAERILQETATYGADVIFDFVGAQSTMELAIGSIAPEGLIRFIGLGGGAFTYMAGPRETNPLPWGVNIQSSFGGVRADKMQVISLAQQGKLHIETTTYPLEQFQRAFDDLRAGKIPGRAVLVP